MSIRVVGEMQSLSARVNSLMDVTGQHGKNRIRVPVGLTSYEKSFGLQFVHETDTLGQAESRTRILVSDHRYGMPWDLAGKKIAIVGNGVVKGCGSLIDSCDEVIRISTMRNWQQSAEHDGLKTTIWAGHPWLVIHRGPTGDLIANPKFAQLMSQQPRLWAVSPFHTSVDSFRWLCEKQIIDRTIFNRSWADVYEVACSKLDFDGIKRIFSFPERKDIVGLNNYELLLTGTRILLLLYLCGVSNLSIFGTNLFNFSKKDLWFGHDLNQDFYTMNYIKKKVLEDGGEFYWNEEHYVRRSKLLNKIRIL